MPSGDGIHGSVQLASLPVTTLDPLPQRTVELDLASARSDGRTSQGSLLVVVPIKPGAEDALSRILSHIADPPGGEDLELNPILPFRRLETTHFARILIHPESPSAETPLPDFEGEPQVAGPAIPAKLLFSTDHDGSLTHHLDELLRVAGIGLDLIFDHTVGWPGHGQRDAAHRFFRDHRLPSNTFYTGTMNRSVAQICRESELRDAIEDFMDADRTAPDFPTDPIQIRERIRRRVFAQERFQWATHQPGPFPKLLLSASLVNHPVFIPAVGVSVVAIVVALLAAVSGAVAAGVAMAAVAAFLYLRYLAATDPVIIRDDVQEHTARLVRTEDRIVQNEMSSVIYIKRPLWFRRPLLRAVLAFINFSAKYLSNQGTLAGIPSIHFARWVIVDQGRRLLFFSNFDGSWENYLGDFIDKAHTGLTAVWSNCVGFPRTVGLTGKGATDEQRFKAYSRQSQVPTQVWYSAYRWLSVSNINDNTRLRLGLYGDMDAEQATAWLRAAVARKATAIPPPAKPADTLVDLDDVQGLVARSYHGLGQAAYLPVVFETRKPAAAKAWLAELAGRVTPATRSSASVEADGQALNLALTYTGLQALGLDERVVAGFSREFKEGMAGTHRQRLLGDTGPADPAEWVWGGPTSAIDAMLLLYAATPDQLDAMRRDEVARATRYGALIPLALESVRLPADKEHFGFHDGIAQPRIAGLKADGDPNAPPIAMIPAGEVVLGYRNAYGILPMSATVPDDDRSGACLAEAPADPTEPHAARRRDLGRNGSYVVFRQLDQDVKGFWKFVDRCAKSDPEARKRLAAKMVGRWPNGAPLVLFPTEEPSAFDETKANAFFYQHDLAGDRCPIGAHIRRSNPRDGLMPNRADSLLVADRHRLLRRGRAYGPPLAPSFDPADILKASDTTPRGLHFICFNTDIARQFEFVQSTWVNNMKFDGLYADPDPIVAPHVDPAQPGHEEEVANFTIQRTPLRERVARLPPFVTTIGGAYLFMPGLKALKYLAADPGNRSPTGTAGV